MWCDAVCRVHGITGEFGPTLWASAVRTPDRYPDAVTLTPDATEDAVLAAIDGSAGASVKDSFSVLDLRPRGFEVLFDASWIHREPAEPPPDGRIAWESGRHDGMAPDEVTALTGRAGATVVARAIANLAHGVLGLSNVTTSEGWLDETWRSVAAAVQARFPRTPIVGYEEGAVLACALRHGFDVLGPVRIWIRSR